MIANIAQFWRLTRELDVQSLREAFETPVSVRVLGSDFLSAQRVARLIEPDPEAGEVSAAVLGNESPEASYSRQRADLYVVALGGPLEPSARRALSDLTVSESPLVLVHLLGHGGDVLVVGVPEERIVSLEPGIGDDEARDRLFTVLVRSAPEVMLAAGRRHPLLREPVAEHLIRDTSRVNAQFAAISSIPANIPLLGGLMGDMADILVLTKNQVLLLFKLAGLYGRDLTLGRQLLVEITPVVGSAFVWRSAARTLLGLVPGLLGMLPKTMVAYSGTYVVGQMARYYYRYGRKPPPGFAQELREESLKIARDALSKIRRRS